MHDRLHVMPFERLADQRIVIDRSFDEIGAGIDRPAKAGREIVEHHHRIAGIEQREHGVAADIAGAAGHENGRSGHEIPLGVSFTS